VLVVGGYLAGNFWYAGEFIAGGRGHYRAALDHMARASRETTIRVSSTSDLRTAVLLAFYERYLPPDRALVFYPRASRRVGEAEWRIREDVEPTATVPSEIDDASGARYGLVARYPFRGLSGAQWSLYRRVEAPPVRPAPPPPA